MIRPDSANRPKCAAASPAGASRAIRVRLAAWAGPMKHAERQRQGPEPGLPRTTSSPAAQSDQRAQRHQHGPPRADPVLHQPESRGAQPGGDVERDAEDQDLLEPHAEDARRHRWRRRRRACSAHPCRTAAPPGSAPAPAAAAARAARRRSPRKPARAASPQAGRRPGAESGSASSTGQANSAIQAAVSSAVARTCSAAARSRPKRRGVRPHQQAAAPRPGRPARRHSRAPRPGRRTGRYAPAGATCGSIAL